MSLQRTTWSGAMPKIAAFIGMSLAGWLLAAGPASAGIGGTPTPTMLPGPLNVGDSLSPSPQTTPPQPNIIITNDSDGANVSDYVSVVNLFITPSCGGSGATCPALNVDPGVFQISATATGGLNSSCQDVTFNLAVTNGSTGEMSIVPVSTNLTAAMDNSQTTLTIASASGFITSPSLKYLIQIDSEWMLVTGGQGTTTLTVTRGFQGSTAAAHLNNATVTQLITLGPTEQGAGEPPSICEIDFSGTVAKVPTKDSSGSAGTQTNTLTRAGFRSSINQSLVPNAGSSTTTITGPNLTITKNPKNGSIVAGQQAIWTILVDNTTGTGDANNIVLHDSLPNVAGLNWQLSGANLGDCAITGSSPQVLDCTTLSVPAGGTKTLTITATTDVNSCTEMTNTAAISAYNGNQVSLQDTGAINCTVPSAVLQISKTDGTTQYTPGTTTTYTIVVHNTGPNDALGTVVSDPIPGQITSWTWTCQSQTGNASGCTPSGGAINTNFTDTVDLPVGGTITYQVVASISSAATGVLHNAATATPPQPSNPVTATDDDDPNPIADLWLTKTDGVTSLNLGASTTYTVVVHNSGPSDAVNAPFNDPVPAGLSITGWTCAASSGSSCGSVSGSGTISTTVSLKAGGTATFTVNAQLSSVWTSPVTNTATITTPVDTTNPGTSCTTQSAPNARSFNAQNGSCTASDTDTVNLFTYTIQKTPSSSSLPSNSALSFTIAVTNNGQSDASGSVLTDPAILGFVASSATCTNATGGASCAGIPGNQLAALQGAGIVLSPFPAGATYTFQLDGNFSATSGSIINTATVCPATALQHPELCKDGPATVSVFTPPPPRTDVPTLGEYALITLMLLLGALGAFYTRRQRS